MALPNLNQFISGPMPYTPAFSPTEMNPAFTPIPSTPPDFMTALLAGGQADPAYNVGFNQPVNKKTLSNDVQYLTGAKQPYAPGVAETTIQNFRTEQPQDIATTQQPAIGMTMLSSLGGGGIGFNDYASSIASAYNGSYKPASEISTGRFNDQLKQINALTEMQKNMAQADLYSSGMSGGVIPAYNPVTGQMEFVPKMMAATSGMMPQPPSGQKYGQNGRLIPSEPSTRDQIRIEKSALGADTAAQSEALLLEAKDILGRYTTNKAAPILGQMGQFLNVFKIGDPQKVADFERLKTISTDLGVKKLQEFGGNDTNMDLQQSIITSLQPGASVQSNIINVQKKLIAGDILQQKPVFEEEWLAKTGALTAPDPQTGETFSSAWLRKQREIMDSVGWEQLKAGEANPQGNAGASEGGGPVQIRDENEYNQLAPGTSYIDPVGNTRVKR